MSTSEEEATTTPVNYFGDDSPGKGFEEGIEDEKMKILRLVAEHGSTGQRMYDEAAQRARQTQTNAKGEAVKGNMSVPLTTIRAVEADFDNRLSLFNDILASNAQAAREDTMRRQSIEAIYKDSVSGDASLEAEAQKGIDAFNEAVAEAEAARAASSGGGSYRGGGEGTNTLPASYFKYDPTRVAGHDPAYTAQTGIAAPPVSIEQSMALEAGPDSGGGGGSFSGGSAGGSWGDHVSDTKYR